MIGRFFIAALGAAAIVAARSQLNPRAMLERLARGLGYERVTVRFEQPPEL